ncbi:MAG: DEAD/DEAH box helicase [Chloroflexi bacterium]|nr:DEAD/DEAH box helicase [Chloroflexota bacterium]
MVYRSWDTTRPYLAQVVERFARLWEGRERGWVALPIPEAVRQRLLAFCPERPPERDPLENPARATPTTLREAGPCWAVAALPAAEVARARLRAQFVRDAPYLPDAWHLGAATAPVEPWPHQQSVADAVVKRFPESCLIADEVGLGKTIEAGLVLRQLVLSGRVRRALVLAPKSVLRQWQEELYEKFALDVPRYDGATFWSVHGTEQPPTTPNPFDSVALALASSQLAKRRDRQTQLLAAQPWDLVIVDEAHHARRRQFDDAGFQPNRLLELLHALRRRTRGLLLLTATPMQIHPIEMWDLLVLLGLGGRWGATSDEFLRFFAELRRPFEEADWDFVFDLVRDYLASGGSLDAIFAQRAQAQLGPVEWELVRTLPDSSKRESLLRQLSPAGRRVAVEFARRHTPLRRYVYRHTRALLREYHRRGLLKASVPTRAPQPVWIVLRPAERALYDRIEEYVAEFYARYEAQRRGLGFVMTVYRRRLTSSFYAIARSLERRLAFLEGRAPTPGLDDDDLEQDDLDLDVGEEVLAADRQLYQDEIAYVRDFLRDLDQLASDSKLEWLLSALPEIFRHRDTVVVFTQYTDTMDYLRERLRAVYGAQVACYSGRGGEVWRDGRWQPMAKEALKQAFRAGEQVKLLVCTEAASEGLNLQTCGVLINYDLPWNPMRVEQRIGRLDRIGQRYPVVWIRNCFYADTIEARVYERLSDRIDWFQTVVGTLQPILGQVARSLQTLAMLPPAERAQRLETELAQLRRDLDAQESAALELDALAEAAPLPAPPTTPVTLADLEQVLTQAPELRARFAPHPALPGAYELRSGASVVAVTFDRWLFEERPYSLRLLTYGEPLFTTLLEEIALPARATDMRGVLRCAVEGRLPLRAYYRPGEPPRPLARLADLDAVGGDEILVWSTEQRLAAEAAFSEAICDLLARERAVEAARAEGARRLLVERGRRVLQRAAMVALVQRTSAAARASPPVDLPGTVSVLQKLGYPFAPLLKLVGTDGVMPAANASYLADCLQASPSVLARRLERLRTEAKQLVHELAPLSGFGTGGPAAAPPAEVMPPPVDSALLALSAPEARSLTNGCSLSADAPFPRTTG